MSRRKQIEIGPQKKLEGNVKHIDLLRTLDYYDTISLSYFWTICSGNVLVWKLLRYQMMCFLFQSTLYLFWMFSLYWTCFLAFLFLVSLYFLLFFSFFFTLMLSYLYWTKWYLNWMFITFERDQVMILFNKFLAFFSLMRISDVSTWSSFITLNVFLTILIVFFLWLEWFFGIETSLKRCMLYLFVAAIFCMCFYFCWFFFFFFGMLNQHNYKMCNKQQYFTA